MSFVKRDLPLIILSACGLMLLLNFFVPTDFGNVVKAELTTWTVIIGCIGTFLGIYYMTISQWRLLQKNKTTIQYFYFATIFGFMILWLAVGLYFPGGVTSPQYLWLQNNLYRNQAGMVYGVMFFTLSSSAYRTFTIRSIESFALLVGGVIYMLRQIPIFPAMWPGLLPLGEWILMVPNVGGGRGAVICAALAALVVGIRTLSGREATMMEVQ